MASNDYEARPLLYVPTGSRRRRRPTPSWPRNGHVLGSELKRVYINQIVFASWRALTTLLRLVRIFQQTNVPTLSHTEVFSPRLHLLEDKGSQARRGFSLSYFLSPLLLCFTFPRFNRSLPSVTAQASAGSSQPMASVRCFFGSKPALPQLSTVPVAATTNLPSGCPKPQLTPQPRALNPCLDSEKNTSSPDA